MKCYKITLIIPFIVLFFVQGCRPLDDSQKSESTVGTARKKTDTSTITPPTEAEPTSSATATEADPTATATPRIVDTSEDATPTQINVVNLEFCHHSNLGICIGSFNLTANNDLYMVLIIEQNNNIFDYYLLFDETKHDCVPITGFSDRYYCPRLPALINEYVFIEVYSSESSIPLAEGDIFVYVPLVPSPTPKPIKPPDPYSP